MNELQPGATGEPLPGSAFVLRSAFKDSSGNVHEAAFDPSSADEASPLQAVSVFAERFTTLAELRTFVSARHTIALRLTVDTIRATLPRTDLPHVKPLDVVWDNLTNADSSPDTRPGAIGHAGITGLVRPPAVPRAVFKELRSRLTQSAEIVPLPAQETTE